MTASTAPKGSIISVTTVVLNPHLNPTARTTEVTHRAEGQDAAYMPATVSARHFCIPGCGHPATSPCLPEL
jgi:hypothetical protein